MTLTAMQKYQHRVTAANSLLCVGLDSRLDRLPARFRDDPHPQFACNRWIIEQTHAVTCAYKPNLAFYEARGAAGWHDLALTMDYLRAHHPAIFTIADAKRADIGSTNTGYVQGIFDELGFDAVTLHPYLGREALQPFLKRADKVSIILCRTSNPGAGEFQELMVDGQPLWSHVARRVSQAWNQHSNCMLVVGATAPAQLKTVRDIVGDIPLLVPGIGTQGGDLQAVLANGLTADGRGLLINAARSIIFADDPAAEARTLHAAINRERASSL